MTRSPGQPCPGPPGFNIFCRVVPDAGEGGGLGLALLCRGQSCSSRRGREPVPLWVLDLVTFQGPP